MATKLWEAPSINAFQTTLNGTIDDDDVTITLSSVTGLVSPGVLVIDRQDGVGNDTPTKREYISYTGISGSDLTGVTREVAGSTGQAHSSGALVEAIPSVTHWGDLVDFLQVDHDALGGHLISTATILTHLNASGASITGNIVNLDGAQTITGVKSLSATPLVDAIDEKTGAAGVTIDSLLIKDGTPANWDGWIIGNETWVYVSATSFKIEGVDVTAKYPKGTRIRYKQGGAYEYGTVVSAAANADTTITLCANNDYALADAAITDNYYSYVTCPQGYPAWFGWTPVYTGGTMTYTTVTTRVGKFSIFGKTVILQLSATGTTGGSASAGLRFTLPIIQAHSNTRYIGGGAYVFDGAHLVGMWAGDSNNTTIIVYKDGAANWGIGAGREILVNMSYEMA